MTGQENSPAAHISLGPTSQTATLKEINTDYSRLTLALSYDSYSYFDTTKTQSFSVHRITENIDTRYNAGAYTNSHVTYDASPLGTTSFVPYPHRADSLEIPLSDELGKQLYELSRSGAASVLNSADFLKMIRGLVVLPDTTTSAAILGFSTNPELRLYYIDKTSQPADEKYLSFSVTSSGNKTRYFNAIKGNRKATRLASLLTRRTGIPSQLTDDEAYLQGGTALQIRLEIPYIKSILRDDDKLIISSAILRFKPIHKTWLQNAILPTELSVYSVNAQNERLAAYGNPKFYKDEVLDRDSYYELDIASFIKTQLAITENNNNALLIRLTDGEASSVNRLCIGDQANEDAMQFKLYVVAVM